MAGPNLEVARFGFYVFFPIAMMLHYGNPDWFEKHVVPARDKLFPHWRQPMYMLCSLGLKPPTDPHEIKNEISRLKAERLARWAAKE
ncbi:hypothetical protein BS47DRAFT_1248851, partial [Hydnum rufescens UP504]